MKNETLDNILGIIGAIAAVAFIVPMVLFAIVGMWRLALSVCGW